MHQHRIYLSPSRLEGASIRLEGTEARYLTRVLRLRKGDELTAFDGQGRSRRAVISACGRDRVVLALGAARFSEEPPWGLFIAQGLLKAAAMDTVVRKCTELGVRGIIGFHTRRSIPRPAGGTDEKRIARERKIAIEACRQCGRDFLPSVRMLPCVDELVRLFDGFDRVLLASLSRQAVALGVLLSARPPGETHRLLIVIGPEGDLSREENDILISRGAEPCRLSDAVLRADTAAVAAAAIAAHHFLSMEERR